MKCFPQPYLIFGGEKMEKTIIEKILGMKLYNYQYKFILDLLKSKELKNNDINCKTRARVKDCAREIS